MRRLLVLGTWLQLQVLVATVTADAGNHDNYTAPSVINVGLLQPLEGPLGFEMTGSAATMAVRDAQRRGYLNETDVKYSSLSVVSGTKLLRHRLADIIEILPTAPNLPIKTDDGRKYVTF